VRVARVGYFGFQVVSIAFWALGAESGSFGEGVGVFVAAPLRGFDGEDACGSIVQG